MCKYVKDPHGKMRVGNSNAKHDKVSVKYRPSIALQLNGLENFPSFVLMTLHRPNLMIHVDDPFNIFGYFTHYPPINWFKPKP